MAFACVGLRRRSIPAKYFPLPVCAVGLVKAPTTVKALLPYLRAARKRGFSMIVEVFAPGMTAMSAPIRDRQGRTIGVITIAGPVFRLSEERMLALGPQILAAAGELADAAGASPWLRARAA